ncbi:nucleotidase [Bacillus sp. FJAT-18017]|uniref:5' nucleotidase, NT5C type n=1 Tax=Bacillus sp. FJAT-18017 TaxID=1705566 RepID=UPI0006ADE2C9|nr:HAD family acid phosphatase [Bacillus sp. FJAT-18017]ALC91253.1 nucleotidase [Bacillus sp. FJAT-18017]
MKFGFDIDDTLINLREHAFGIYNKKFNKQVPIEEFHKLKRVEIHEPFGMTDEEGRQAWLSSLEEIYFTTCPAYPGAVEALNKLAEQGHEIYYITSRPEGHRERTIEWMKENGFPVEDSRFFYGMRDTEKVDIIRDMKLDYYFDDKPDVLNTLLKEEGLKVYIKDQSYNKHLEFPRILDWSELGRILEKETEN